jgi:hypothetical protein
MGGVRAGGVGTREIVSEVPTSWRCFCYVCKGPSKTRAGSWLTPTRDCNMTNANSYQWGTGSDNYEATLSNMV